MGALAQEGSKRFSCLVRGFVRLGASDAALVGEFFLAGKNMNGVLKSWNGKDRKSGFTGVNTLVGK